MSETKAAWDNLPSALSSKSDVSNVTGRSALPEGITLLEGSEYFYGRTSDLIRNSVANSIAAGVAHGPPREVRRRW